MKSKKSLLVLIAALAIVAGLSQGCSQKNQQNSTTKHSASPIASPHTSGNARVPAHHTTAPAAGELKPVLAAAQFSGKTREAYEVVKKIPATIAQMPCYCHCDRGMGHKSLHSCFEDEHAAHCAMCVDEALMTFELQKQGLSPAQIRERIIAQFGS